MNDLIRRTDAKNAISNYCKMKLDEIMGEREEVPSGELQPILKLNKELSKKIREIPTVEAVPVVHGEWIHVQSSDMATGRAYECSNCKKMRYGSFMPPFCQMCGADMRTSAE